MASVQELEESLNEVYFFFFLVSFDSEKILQAPACRYGILNYLKLLQYHVEFRTFNDVSLYLMENKITSDF